jgi:hypothetical protein
VETRRAKREAPELLQLRQTCENTTAKLEIIRDKQIDSLAAATGKMLVNRKSRHLMQCS